MNTETLKHSYDFEVLAEHIDELGHVNNVVYVQWIQDAAVQHWNRVAPEHIIKNYVWVIVRHEIDYKRPALAGDILHIETQVLNAERVSSVRQVKIFRKDGMKLLVEAQTTWCMIDLSTQRPVSIPDEIKVVFLGDKAEKKS